MRLIWIPVLLIVASLSWAGLSLSQHFKTNAELDQLKQLGGDLTKIRQRNTDLKAGAGLQAEMERLRKENEGFDEAKKENEKIVSEKAETDKRVRELQRAQIEARREKLATENQLLQQRTKEAQSAAHAATQPICFQMMKQIQGAKEQWALENRKDATGLPTAENLALYLRGAQLLKCPAGGTHTINYVGQLPICSVHGSLAAAR